MTVPAASRTILILPVSPPEDILHLAEILLCRPEQPEQRERALGARGVALLRCFRRAEVAAGPGETPSAAAAGLVQTVLNALEPHCLSEILEKAPLSLRLKMPRLKLPQGPGGGCQLTYEVEAISKEARPEVWERYGRRLFCYYLGQAVAAHGVASLAPLTEDSAERARAVAAAFGADPKRGGIGPAVCSTDSPSDDSGQILLVPKEMLVRLAFEEACVLYHHRKSFEEASAILSRVVSSAEGHLRSSLNVIDAGDFDAVPPEKPRPIDEAVVMCSSYDWSEGTDDVFGVDLVMLWEARGLLARCLLRRNGEGDSTAAAGLLRRNVPLSDFLYAQALAIEREQPSEADILAPISAGAGREGAARAWAARGVDPIPASERGDAGGGGARKGEGLGEARPEPTPLFGDHIRMGLGRSPEPRLMRSCVEKFLGATGRTSDQAERLLGETFTALMETAPAAAGIEAANEVRGR